MGNASGARPGSQKEKRKFSEILEDRAKSASSRTILALDFDHREDTSKLLSDAIEIVSQTRKYLCAVKLNFHLILPLSLGELKQLNQRISLFGLPTIADIKLNDISNTNRVAAEYLWDAGFSCIIANPFAGYEDGLDSLMDRARSLGNGVILLGYMSHRGAQESYGLELRDGRKMYELFIERALHWHAYGVIMGSTRPEEILKAKNAMDQKVKIFSPGSGAQGGDPIASLKAGADYLIFGRSILSSADPGAEAKKIRDFEAAWIETH